MTKRKKITCWYRVIDGEWKYNHFTYGWEHYTYGWTNRTAPFPVNKKQEQMWKDVKWEKTYGYLVDGVVKEFSCDVCPYYPNCENDTCDEAFTEYEKRQREKAIESMKEVQDNDT